MTLKEIQEEIIEEFAVFDEWMDKYEFLIELGQNLPAIDVKFKNNEYLINGCQSKVWLNAELIDGKVQFTADSDAIITKGIVALLVRVLSNRAPEEIMNAKLFFIDHIGLTDNLSPTRSNGLVAMVKQMKLYGMAFNAKLNK
ncbi:MAG: SufE family protein [Bacteroidetes bacterium]|nr:MAG: SufE family protein [Bacteroidota bacterium]RLD80672.1 MAG: SufE family protein [Bacteroidota bacterium]